MCEALRILMKPEIDAEISAAEEKGMHSIITIISRLKGGEQPAVLISEGFSDEAVKMAEEVLK